LLKSKLTIGILSLLTCAVVSAGTAPDCGLPESWDSPGVTTISAKDLREKVELSPSEQTQVFALAQYLHSLEKDKNGLVPVTVLDTAILYLMDAFREELYVDRIMFNEKKFTLIYGWPGDNRGGFVLNNDTLEVIGDVDEDGLVCKTPILLKGN
jgi:hypothetical protein